jgi:hypothetical protein
MIKSHVRAFILGHKPDRSDGRHALDSRILQWFDEWRSHDADPQHRDI